MLNNNYRLLSYISPRVEEDLVNYNINEDLLRWFVDVTNFYSEIKYISIFVIPVDYIQIFQSNKILKMVKEIIESDTQSNIIFGKIENRTECDVSNADTDNIISGYPSAIITKRAIINSLNDCKVPLLVDNSNYSLVKESCNECNLPQLHCQDQYVFEIAKVPFGSHEIENLSKLILQNINKWHLNREKVTTSDLKCLSYLNGLLYGMEQDKLQKIYSYDIFDDIVKDIKDSPNNDLSNIAFSMLRAIAYTNTQSKNRHKLSIDCHQNNPSRLKGYDLQRVDVVPANRSGVCSSGTERLLIAKNKNRYCFLYYTSHHDFCLKTINERLSRLE